MKSDLRREETAPRQRKTIPPNLGMPGSSLPSTESKLIPSFTVGKRTWPRRTLLLVIVERLANRVQLTTDGFRFYVDAVEKHFGADVDFGQVIKLYGDYGQHDAAGRYSHNQSWRLYPRFARAIPIPSTSALRSLSGRTSPCAWRSADYTAD